jgi:hypothetical protein
MQILNPPLNVISRSLLSKSASPKVIIISGFHCIIVELEDTDTSTPPTRVVSKIILVEFLGIREERFTLFMGYEPISLTLAYFSMVIFIITSWCMVHVGF